MDDREAIEILERELAQFRGESYSQLVGRIGYGPVVFVRTGASGREYQLEIDVLWDGVPNGDVRVIGSVDDGGWRAFLPLTRSFIKSPDGSFVGE